MSKRKVVAARKRTATPVAPVGTLIYPADNARTIVDAAPINTEFTFMAGTHRADIRPKAGQKFYGERDAGGNRLATLQGTSPLTNWTLTSGKWSTTYTIADTLSGPSGGPNVGSTGGRTGFTRHNDPNDVYINNEPLKQVGAVADVVVGTFHSSYVASTKVMTITIVDNPTGKTVELSVLEAAFWATATGVTVQDLNVTKYATPTMYAGIGRQGASNWLVNRCHVSLCHAYGVRLEGNSTLSNTTCTRMGMLGAKIRGTGYTLSGCNISNNDLWAGYNYKWDGGGFKTGEGVNATIINNVVSDNVGSGLWLDVFCDGVEVAGNTTNNNGQQGIFIEGSNNVHAHDNTSIGNGFDGWPRWLYNSQILLSRSSNCLVNNNTAKTGAAYGEGITSLLQDLAGVNSGQHSGNNNEVRNNTVTLLHSAAIVGFKTDITDPLRQAEINAYYASQNFHDNTYYSVTPSGTHFKGAASSNQTLTTAKANGQELGSTIGPLP